MTSAHWVIAMLTATALIYSGTAFAYFFSSRPGMAICFVGYVLANIGLVFDALHQAAK